MAELAFEKPSTVVAAPGEQLLPVGDEAQLSPTTPVYRRGYFDFDDDEQDHHDHDHHHEKRSVLSKVKDKAKKWRHMLAKKKHGHHEGSSPTSWEVTFFDEDEDQEEDPEYHGAPMYESEMAPNAYKEMAMQHQVATHSSRASKIHRPNMGNEEPELQNHGHNEPALIHLDAVRETSSTHRIKATSHVSPDKHLLEANTKKGSPIKGSGSSIRATSPISPGKHLQEANTGKGSPIKGSGSNITATSPVSPDKHLLEANTKKGSPMKESGSSIMATSPISPHKHLLEVNTKQGSLVKGGGSSLMTTSPASSDKHLLEANTKQGSPINGSGSSMANHTALSSSPNSFAKRMCEVSIKKSWSNNTDHPAFSELQLLMANAIHEDTIKGRGGNKPNYNAFSDKHHPMGKEEHLIKECCNGTTPNHTTSVTHVMVANTDRENPIKECGKRNADHHASHTLNSDIQLQMANAKHEVGSSKVNHHALSVHQESGSSRGSHPSLSNKNILGVNSTHKDPIKESGRSNSDTQLLMSKPNHADPINEKGSNRARHPVHTNKNLLGANTKHEDTIKESDRSNSDTQLSMGKAKHADPTRECGGTRTIHPASTNKSLLGSNTNHGDPIKESGRSIVSHHALSDTHILTGKSKHGDTVKENSSNNASRPAYTIEDLLGDITKTEEPIKENIGNNTSHLALPNVHLRTSKAKHDDQIKESGSSKTNHPASSHKNLLGTNTKHGELTEDSDKNKRNQLAFSDNNPLGVNAKHEYPIKKGGKDTAYCPASSDSHLLMAKMKHKDLNEGCDNSKPNHPAFSNKSFGDYTRHEGSIEESSSNKGNNPTSSSRNHLAANTECEDLIMEGGSSNTNHLTVLENLLMAKGKHEEPKRERIRSKVNHPVFSDTRLSMAKINPEETMKGSVRNKGNHPAISNTAPLGANAEHKSLTGERVQNKANNLVANEDILTANTKQNDPIKESGRSNTTHPALSDIQLLRTKSEQEGPIKESSDIKVIHPALSDTQLLMARKKHEDPIKQTSSIKAKHPAYSTAHVSTASTKHEELIEEHGSSKILYKTVSKILAPTYAMVSDTSHTIASKILCPTDGDEIGVLQEHDPVKELSDTFSGMLAPAYTMVSDASRRITSKIQGPTARDETDSELLPASFHEIARDKTVTETVSEMLTPAYTAVSDASHVIASKIHSPTTTDETRVMMDNESIKKSSSHKTLTERVSKMLAPASTMMLDASHKIATKIQGQADGDETGAKQILNKRESAAHIHVPTIGDEIEVEEAHDPIKKSNSRKTLTETVSKMLAPASTMMSDASHKIATKIQGQPTGDETGAKRMWDKGVSASEIHGPTENEIKTEEAHDPIKKNSSRKTLTETMSKMLAPASTMMSDTSHKIATKIQGQSGGDETGAKRMCDKGVPASEIHGPTTRNEIEVEEEHDPIKKSRSLKVLTETVSNMLSPAYTVMSDASHKIATKIQGQSGGDETGVEQVWDKRVIHGPTTRDEIEAEEVHDPIKKSSSHKTLTETVSKILSPTYTMVSDASQKIATKIQGQVGGNETGAEQVWDKRVAASEIHSPKIKDETEMEEVHDPIKKSNSHKKLSETVSKMLSPAYTMMSDASHKIATTIKGQSGGDVTGTKKAWDKGMPISIIQGPTNRDEINAKMTHDPIKKSISNKTMTETKSEMLSPAYTVMSEASHKTATKIQGQAGGDETGAEQVWDIGVSASKIQGPTFRDEIGVKMVHEQISDKEVSAPKIQCPTTKYEIGAKMENDPIMKSSSHKTLAEAMSEILAPVYTIVSDVSHKIASKIQTQASGKETETKQMSDKGVSVKEYLMHKLEPGEEDKALSQVITEAMISGKTGQGQVEEIGMVEKVKVAVSSLLGREEHPESIVPVSSLLGREEHPESIVPVSSLLVMEEHTKSTDMVSSLLAKEEYTGPVLPISTQPHAVEIEEIDGRSLQACCN